MSLSTFVKVGEITNLSDARYCAGMGVDLLGFNVVENTSTYVDPEKFQGIVGWVVGVSYCAELGNHEPNTELMEALKKANITYIESSSEVLLERVTGFQKIFKIHVSEETITTLHKTLADAGSFADMVLIECENENLFERIDEAVKSRGGSVSVLKAYGLSSERVNELSKNYFHGVALKGSEEIKPGYKDFDELAEILEALEVD